MQCNNHGLCNESRYACVVKCRPAESAVQTTVCCRMLFALFGLLCCWLSHLHRRETTPCTESFTSPWTQAETSYGYAVTLEQSFLTLLTVHGDYMLPAVIYGCRILRLHHKVHDFAKVLATSKGDLNATRQRRHYIDTLTASF